MAFLRMENITKRFPGTVAVRSVTIDCRAGEVLGLVGENGAGKSTLMNVLGGVHQPDEGTIYINDVPKRFRGYSDARRAGVGVVYQNLSLLSDITVAENIVMGGWPRGKGRLISWSRIDETAKKLLARVGLEIDHRTLVSSLGMPERQLVEIAKVINQDPDIVVFDEPTAPLSRREVEQLFRVIGELKDAGKSVIFISHRLEEVLRISDRLTVMKDAEVVVTDDTEHFDEDRIISSMVGRDIQELFPPKVAIDSDAPETLHFSAVLERSDARVEFVARRGEILGFGGLQGQGQLDTLRALFGLGGCSHLHVSVADEPVRISHPRDAMSAGIAMVPDNRLQYGVFSGRTVRENLTVSTLQARAHFGVVDRRAETEAVRESIEQLSVRLSSPEQPIESLSGGNMQKVVVGRWLLFNPRVVIALEPTQGIDVGTKQQLYTLLRQLADEGIVVVLYTTDMLELVGLCNRVLVMNHGMLTGNISGGDISEESIMRAAVSSENILQERSAG